MLSPEMAQGAQQRTEVLTGGEPDAHPAEWNGEPIKAVLRAAVVDPYPSVVPSQNKLEPGPSRNRFGVRGRRCEEIGILGEPAEPVQPLGLLPLTDEFLFEDLQDGSEGAERSPAPCALVEERLMFHICSTPKTAHNPVEALHAICVAGASGEAQ